MGQYGDGYMRMKFCFSMSVRNEDITSQRKISDSEYIFIMNDGKKYLYETIGDIVKQIGCFNTDYVNDELWKKEFSRRVKKMAFRKGYYIKDLAVKLGISENTMSRYMNGKTIPNAFMVKRLSEILGCSIDYLTNFDYLL